MRVPAPRAFPAACVNLCLHAHLRVHVSRGLFVYVYTCTCVHIHLPGQALVSLGLESLCLYASVSLDINPSDVITTKDALGGFLVRTEKNPILQKSLQEHGNCTPPVPCPYGTSEPFRSCRITRRTADKIAATDWEQAAKTQSQVSALLHPGLRLVCVCVCFQM